MLRRVIGLATGNWQLIAKVLGVLGILAALWFLIVAPRMENARLEREKVEHALKVEQDRVKAIEVLVQAQQDIAAEHAANIDKAAAETQIREIRTTEIRDRIVERASKPEGDPLVSDGFDSFLKDVAQ